MSIVTNKLKEKYQTNIDIGKPRILEKAYFVFMKTHFNFMQKYFARVVRKFDKSIPNSIMDADWQASINQNLYSKTFNLFMSLVPDICTNLLIAPAGITETACKGKQSSKYRDSILES